MESDPVIARIRGVGRVAAWLVILILAAATVYTAIIAIVNWGPIGV